MLAATVSLTLTTVVSHPATYKVAARVSLLRPKTTAFFYFLFLIDGRDKSYKDSQFTNGTTKTNQIGAVKL